MPLTLPTGGVNNFTLTPSSPNAGLFAGTQQSSDLCAILRGAGLPCDRGGLIAAGTQGIINLFAGSDTQGGPSASCPPPLVPDNATGQCVSPGSPADTSMGGVTTTGYGDAVMGLFGVPALRPAIVGQRTNARGETVPIRQCPPGVVLGKDNLCYAKGSIPNKMRKWPKAAKPPITAADAKAIRKAASAKNRVKKLAGSVGFTCKKR